MFTIDYLLLLSGALILLGVVSSKFAARAGLPALILFMGIGMLAGSEGPGGIAFEQFELAHAVGTVALALILFDGGLQTSLDAIKRGWRPAGVLATVGVVITAMVTALGVAWVLRLDWPMALLFGSIMASTDAAAVFSILRGQGLSLSPRLAATLELESGANDPMAVFLTLLSIEIIRGTITPGPAVLSLFAVQMGVGLGVGLLCGWLGAHFINRIRLKVAGLYPVAATAMALTTFGLAAQLGGSGFLAVYLTGLWIGNQRIVFQRGIQLFHDAAAWTAQIVMFTLLGLLSFPSRLVDVIWQGLLVVLVLTFVARPLAVLLTLPFFGFRLRELIFMSWGGLKGAVPIVLATFPLMFGIEGGELLFDMVFMVVLFSAIVQGWSLGKVARLLGLEQPPAPAPRIHLELNALEHVDADIIEYRIDQGAPACNRLLSELALPEEVHIALLAREQHVVATKGHTRLMPGDYAFVVHPRPYRPLVDRAFGGASCEEAPWPLDSVIAFDARHQADLLRALYGEAPELAPGQRLGEAASPQPGGHVEVGRWTLTTHTVGEDGVAIVGLARTPTRS